MIAVVRESNRVIESARLDGDELVLDTYWGASRSIRVHDRKTGELRHEIEAPRCCSMRFDGPRKADDSEVMSVVMSSPARRGVLWELDLKTRRWRLVETSGKKRPADPTTEMMRDGGTESRAEIDLRRTGLVASRAP